MLIVDVKEQYYFLFFFKPWAKVNIFSFTKLKFLQFFANCSRKSLRYIQNFLIIKQEENIYNEQPYVKRHTLRIIIPEHGVSCLLLRYGIYIKQSPLWKKLQEDVLLSSLILLKSN